MKIKVHFHTTLQRQTQRGLQRQTTLEMAPESTLLDLLQLLEIELAPEHLLLVVDGRVADLNHVLAEGEQVSLIPAMSGGDGWFISA
jgi:molybdopterin converting factor small subunit